MSPPLVLRHSRILCGVLALVWTSDQLSQHLITSVVIHTQLVSSNMALPVELVRFLFVLKLESRNCQRTKLKYKFEPVPKHGALILMNLTIRYEESLNYWSDCFWSLVILWIYLGNILSKMHENCDWCDFIWKEESELRKKNGPKYHQGSIRRLDWKEPTISN